MRGKLERKAFNEAELYFNLRQYQSATHSFENMLKDFPETTNGEKIRYMITRAAYLLAENSIYEKKEERYESAAEYSGRFLNRYPDSPYSNEVGDINKNSVKRLKEFSR